MVNRNTYTLLEILQKKAEFLNKIRSFFTLKNILEIEPTLVLPFPEIDSELRPFSFKANSTKQRLFLSTSQEAPLRYYVTKGIFDIYTISHAFRDEAADKTHLSEFSLLEWFRKEFIFEQIIDEALQIIGLFIEGPIEKLSFKELFQKITKKDLEAVTYEDLVAICKEKKIFVDQGKFPKEHYRIMMIDAIYNQCAADCLPDQKIVIIYDFPEGDGGLAKKSKKGCISRAEIYYHRVEIANLYEDENDPESVKNYFENDAIADEKWFLEEFIKLYQIATPYSHGGIGLDRLFAMWLGLDNIHEGKPRLDFRATFANLPNFMR